MIIMKIIIIIIIIIVMIEWIALLSYGADIFAHCLEKF